jgi:hypothetical protein
VIHFTPGSPQDPGKADGHDPFYDNGHGHQYANGTFGYWSKGGYLAALKLTAPCDEPDDLGRREVPRITSPRIERLEPWSSPPIEGCDSSRDLVVRFRLGDVIHDSSFTCLDTGFIRSQVETTTGEFIVTEFIADELVNALPHDSRFGVFIDDATLVVRDLCIYNRPISIEDSDLYVMCGRLLGFMYWNTWFYFSEHSSNILINGQPPPLIDDDLVPIRPTDVVSDCELGPMISWGAFGGYALAPPVVKSNQLAIVWGRLKRRE